MTQTHEEKLCIQSGVSGISAALHWSFVRIIIHSIFCTFRRRATLGDRAFVAAAPALWNNLPLELRAMTNVNTFKRHLKTLLFSRAYN